MTCRTCKNWYPDDKDNLMSTAGGQCRADPPQLLILPGKKPGTIEVNGHWPRTDASLMCGRWTLRIITP